ncbi:MAG: hypothetical protein ABUL55_02850 [Pseudomonadota bacterium]
MSLNKTLDRLFDEIRREARRSPEFAHRIDAVLRGHTSRREIPDEIIEDVKRDVLPPLAGEVSAAKAGDDGGGASPSVSPLARPDSSPAGGGAKRARIKEKLAPPSLNPVGLYQREGEEALVAALGAQDRDALLALVAEHNLDPGGEAGELDRDALAAHVIAQAKRRAERDSKLFDY